MQYELLINYLESFFKRISKQDEVDNERIKKPSAGAAHISARSLPPAAPAGRL